MANMISTSFSHTYAGQEYLTELFYKPQEGRTDVFSDYYRVFTDVKTKKNLYLPGTLSGIVKKYTTCGFSATADAVTITDRILDVEKLKVNLESCVDAIFDTVFEESVKSGVAITDLSGTVVETIAKTKVVEGIKSDVGRICWWAKSGAGSDDYNQFNGWIQLFIDSSSSLGGFYNMGSNTSIEASTGLMATDGAITLLRYIFTNQPKVLRQMPREAKKFYVTATIFDNLLTTYEQLGTGNTVGLTMLMNGTTKLYFRGIEVVEVPGWDTDLADANNPQAAFVGDNLVVYSMKDNLVVGSDVTDPSAELKFRMDDDDDELMKVISKFKLGVQFVHPELVYMAY